MVDRFAAEVQGYSEAHKFYKSGHLMFLYEAEKFHACLSDFVRKADALSRQK